MRKELACNQGFSLGQRHRLPEQAPGHERKGLTDRAQISLRVRSHENEVVALRQDVFVHLLWSLRRDKQVEAELSSLPRDRDSMLRRKSSQGVGGKLGADVVRLVDDDQDRIPSSAVAPQGPEHCLSGQRLLLG